MLASGDDLKVFESIILSIPVDMVNYLGGVQRPPQFFFHYEAMFTAIFADANPDSDISHFVDESPAFPIPVVLCDLEAMTRLKSSRFASVSKNVFSRVTIFIVF